MKKAATGLSCGGFTPPLLQTTRGAAVQSTETDQNARTELDALIADLREGAADMDGKHAWPFTMSQAAAALAAERDRAEARIAKAINWDDYRDASAFGDMGTPYVNGARHAHAVVVNILREFGHD